MNELKNVRDPYSFWFFIILIGPICKSISWIIMVFFFVGYSPRCLWLFSLLSPEHFSVCGSFLAIQLVHSEVSSPNSDQCTHTVRSYLSTIPTYNSHFNSHLNSHFLFSRSGNSFLKNSHFSKKNSHFYLIWSGNLSEN